LIIGLRRLVLIAAIAAVVLVIIFYPLIVYTPIDLGKVSIDLANVRLATGSVEDQKLSLSVTFALKNTNNFTLTTSRIDYELFADGNSLGTDNLSYEDVPVNGRPPLFSGRPVQLSDDSFDIAYSDSTADVFNEILSNSSQIDWAVTGSAVIESGTSFVTKEFSGSL
jgi:hypothetical protein